MKLQPLLTLPKPVKANKIDNLPGGGSTIHHPSAAFQLYISISDSSNGLIPERAIVIETKGDVQDFAKALAKVDGFEFINQQITETDEVNEQIYTTKASTGEHQALISTIYLSMSNQAGINKLLSVWNKFSKDGLIDVGFTPLARALEQLSDIRLWNTQDRIKNTFLLDDWKERVDISLQYKSVDFVPFEIELWYRKEKNTQIKIESKINKIITTHGGSIKTNFVKDEIGYHAIMGILPINMINQVLENGVDSFNLMRCDEVMFFRPLGQCSSLQNDNEVLIENITYNNDEMSFQNENEPVIALFDGLPLEQHVALSNNLIIDDPDSFHEKYTSGTQQTHGTSMASLIIHGDLNLKDNIKTPRPIYVRPIMTPNNPNFNGKMTESIPENHLPLDLIQRAVIRMFDGEGNQKPTAANVKVINLSICDRYRLFDGSMSPLARMIDWLSYKYKVLFVISAGNHSDNLTIDIDSKTFKKASSEIKEELIYKTISRQRWNRRMMSPAESINSITVRASHFDHSNITPNLNQIEPTTIDFFPSTINPISVGHKKSIKPEVLMPGGRITYENKSIFDSDPVNLAIARSSALGPGLKSASPGNTSGTLNGYSYSTGTSNAAALATRRLSFLYETLSSMKSFDETDALSKASDAVILKAMICHGAELHDASRTRIENLFKTKENSRTFKSNESHFLGYGHVNENRIHQCAPNQATLIRTGVLSGDDAETYSFPLPKCLSAQKELRRLVITLAWFSPITPHHNDYSQAQLWVSDAKKSPFLSFENGDYYHHYQKKGTVYHDVIHGEKASVYTDGDTLKLKVNCKCRGGAKDISIPYALIVTLDTSNANLPVYEEVKELLIKINISQELSAKH
jgi:hypothetical protein